MNDLYKVEDLVKQINYMENKFRSLESELEIVKKIYFDLIERKHELIMKQSPFTAGGE